MPPTPSSDRRRPRRAGTVLLALLSLALVPPASAVDPACRGTVYLTLDTGSMSQAEPIAQILQRHGVQATFFLASERTIRGDFSLDDSWAPYWRARVAEGHAFGSHTFDHVYLKPAAGRPDAGRTRAAGADAGAAGAAGGGADPVVAQARPQFGPRAGQSLNWTGRALCDEIARVDTRLKAMTGRGVDPLWRAPAGRAPAAALEAASACGYRHVHWSPAGFLGDELPSETHPNEQLLRQALAGIRAGDILVAHLGIWSRRDPYAPMLDPLIAGLKARGLCFATLREYPGLAAAGPMAAIPRLRP